MGWNKLLVDWTIDWLIGKTLSVSYAWDEKSESKKKEKKIVKDKVISIMNLEDVTCVKIESPVCVDVDLKCLHDNFGQKVYMTILT